MTIFMSTKAPADLLGLGDAVLRPCAGRDLRSVIGVDPAPRVAPFQGTAVPAGSTAARLRPEIQVSVWNTVAHNSIGTTLGICSSRRPQS